MGVAGALSSTTAFAAVDAPKRRFARNYVVRVGKALEFVSSSWVQLLRFGIVGAAGYVVALSVYAGLIDGAHVHYLIAATVGFVAAVTNNYTWNRLWVFDQRDGRIGDQGLRFLMVSLGSLALNLGVLTLLVELGLAKLPAQALSIAVISPASFVVHKVWSFR